MKQIKMKLVDVEETVDEMEELMELGYEVVEEEPEEYQILQDGWWVEIPELSLCLYDGVFLNYDEEEQEYFADFSITIIREQGQDGFYFEQDGMLISLANYLSGKQSIENLLELECVICIPEEDRVEEPLE